MKKRRRRIAVIEGDGIGPEVVRQGILLLEALDKKLDLQLELVPKDWGANKWINEGVGLPDGALEDLSNNYDAIYFGALGDRRIPDMAHGREILLGMRQGLDLYVNMRPIVLLEDDLSPLKGKGREQINFVVFRENTEDLYVSVGGNLRKGSVDEVAMDQSVHTYKGVERIIRHAFEFAVKKGRKKVTLSDKSNAIQYGGSLWQRAFKSVASEYSSIEANHLFVDVMAMEFVRAPERFDVVVTSNLFGDILTDLGAGICGGLGLAASANIHPGKIGLFEPVHGSAPEIAGQNRANPLAAFLTAGMMLEFLEIEEAGAAIEEAVRASLKEKVRTLDVSGSSTTTDVGRFVIERTLQLL